MRGCGGLVPGASWYQNRFARQRKSLLNSSFAFFLEIICQGHWTALDGVDSQREKKGASEDEGRVEHDKTTLSTTSKAIRENFSIGSKDKGTS